MCNNLAEKYLSYLSLNNEEESSYQQYKLLYEIYGKIPWSNYGCGGFSKESIVPNDHSVRVNKQIYSDLNLFYTGEKSQKPISDYIDKTYTKSGKIFLQHILSHPTSDVPFLKWRQVGLHFLLDKNSTFPAFLENNLREMEGLLEDLLWFFDEIPEEINESFNSVLFNQNYLNFLNHWDFTLHWSNTLTILVMPFFSLLSPLLSILLPLIFLKFSGYLPLSWMAILRILWKYMYNYFWSSFFTTFQKLGKIGTVLGITWFGLFVYGVFSTFKESWDKYQIIRKVHNKLNKVARFVTIVHKIYYHPQNKYFRDPAVQCSLHHLWITFNDSIFQSDPGLTTNKGQILVILKNLLKPEEEFMEGEGHGKSNDVSLRGCLGIVIRYIGWLDSYLGIAKLTLEQDPFTFTDYLKGLKKGSQDGSHQQGSSPMVNCKGLWHPALIGKPKVLNDFKTNQKVILTGPNQGGKSTFIRSLLLNIWFSQTLGIANSQQFSLTPFGTIHSYIQINDSVGFESLFEAEMNRMKDFFKELSNTDFETRNKNHLSFAVIDEIFTSTNFQEGLSAALAIGQELMKYQNNLSIITTHFSELTQLENINSTGTGFKNYKVCIDKKEYPNNSGGSHTDIKFLYKIVPGISNDFIALDLIGNKGFGGEIVANAKHYLEQLFL